MLQRSFYIPKDHSPVVEIEELGLEVYSYKLIRGSAAMGFSGKRQKPDFHYIFQILRRVNYPNWDVEQEILANICRVNYADRNGG